MTLFRAAHDCWRYMSERVACLRMREMPASHSIIFHCWRSNDVDAARRIFQSISRNGLLLTTNATTLDTFGIDRGQGVVQMEVMQHPRICFTDVAPNLLGSHGERYGKYGVGFLRTTIINWGGLPAWYLPNYWSNESLKVVGPVLVNSLHAAMDGVRQFQALARDLVAKGIPITVQYVHGTPVSGERLVTEMDNVANALFCVLSFIKEMSPPSAEDYSYLFEREWRLISGFGLAGRAPTSRPLTSEEKEILCSHNPAWRAPRQSQDINITARYGAGPVVDSFQYFNGIPGQGTVTELIDTVLVPNKKEAQWVASYVADNHSLFGRNMPRVVVFPGS